MSDLTDAQRALLARFLPLAPDPNDGMPSNMVNDNDGQLMFEVNAFRTTFFGDNDLAAAIVHHVNNFAALESELRVTRRALELACEKESGEFGRCTDADRDERIAAHMDQARQELEAK